MWPHPHHVTKRPTGSAPGANMKNPSPFPTAAGGAAAARPTPRDYCAGVVRASRPSSKPSRCTGHRSVSATRSSTTSTSRRPRRRKARSSSSRRRRSPTAPRHVLGARHGPAVHEEADERKLATIVLTIGLRTGPDLIANFPLTQFPDIADNAPVTYLRTIDETPPAR